MPEHLTQTVDERSQLGLEPTGPGGHLPAVIESTRRPIGWRGAALVPLALRRGLADFADGQAWRADLARSFDRGMAALFVPVLLCAGALIYFTIPVEPACWWALLAGLASLIGALLAPAGTLRRLACMAMATVVVGALAGKIETWRVGTHMLGSEVTTRLTGRIASIERQSEARARLVIDVLATERPALRYAPQRVRVTVRKLDPDAMPGMQVSGLARLFPPAGPVRPGSYDFAFESYFDGIGASGFFMGSVTLAASADGPTLAARIEQIRYGMARHIEQTVGGAEGAIAAALITGIRAGIPEATNDALRTVGLYHVISISGLHMALVAGTVMVGVRLLLSLFPAFASRRATKKYAAAAALAATAFYLTLSGGEVAAQRSFLMLAVMLLAVLSDRAALTMRNLALSAVAIILVTPHEVVGPSFQMSFAATAALVAVYEAWTLWRRSGGHRPTRRGRVVTLMRKLWSNVLALAATSIIAGAATALFSAWHFQQVAPLGLLANLGAMPFVSVLVMPFAVVAVLAMPFGLDAPALWVMGQGVAAMNAVALRLAPYSALDSTGLVPLPAVLVLTLALALATLAIGRLRMMSVPLLLAGALLLPLGRAPAALVSEDGRLVAVRLADGRVSANLARPPGFTADNWMRAFSVDAFEKPAKVLPTGFGDLAFGCKGDVCVGRTAGQAVVRAATSSAALPHCAPGALVVIARADDPGNCAARGATVLTLRELSRQGGASIYLTGVRDAPFEIAQSVTEPFRAWHVHRQYSRAARGMPEPVRDKGKTAKPAPSPASRPEKSGSGPVSIAGSARPDAPGP